MYSAALTPTMEPVDRSEPILGVSLEQYARVSAAMLRAGITDADAIEEYAVDHGIDPGTWVDIQAGWIERMLDDDTLTDRYRAATAETGDRP